MREDPVCGQSFGSGCTAKVGDEHVCGNPTDHGGAHCCIFCGQSG